MRVLLNWLTLPRRASPFAYRTCTTKTFRILHIPTQILRSCRSIRKLKVDIQKTNIRTRRHSTTLETSDSRRLGCADQIGNSDVSDLELRTGAISLPRGAAEPGALRDCHGRSAHRRGCEVFEDHI